MLDPESRPNTPLIQGPAPPTTPEQHHFLPNSPPNRPSVVHTVHHPSEPEPLHQGIQDIQGCQTLGIIMPTMPCFLLGSIMLSMCWMWQLLLQPQHLQQLMRHQLHHKHRHYKLPM